MADSHLTKICTVCQEHLPLDHFYKKKGGKYGVTSMCKECFSQKGKERNFTFDPEKFGEKLVCSVCKESKHHSLFHNSKASHNGKVLLCKDCQSDIKAQKNNLPEENYDKRLRLCTTCNGEKLGSAFSKSKAGKGGLCSQCKECHSKYKKDNPHIRNASGARRRAIKKQSIPEWYNKEKVDAIYEECSKVSQETGVKHHVDHIIPLTSNYVCGLHSIENLQILPGYDNHQKHNTYWPDMPDKLDRAVAATRDNLAKLPKA